MRRHTLTALLAVFVVMAGIPAIGGAAASLDWGDERAQLDIEQPAYIDSSIDRQESENRTVYSVSGPEQTIRLNQPHEDVVDHGILEGEGDLRYDTSIDAYVLEVSEAGSRVLYWDVERTETVGSGNETVEETTTTRYVATLSVSDVEWVHRPADDDEELREQAGNWSSIAGDLERRAGPGEEPFDVFESMLEVYDFAERPFATFGADARGTIILMTTRPGGLAVLGTILGLATITVATLAKRLKRREDQLETVDDVEQARDQAYLEQARKNAQQVSLTDHFPDDIARSIRDRVGGNNLWAAWRHYSLLRSPAHTKGVTLQLMSQVGYTLRVRRDDQGELVAANAVHRDDLDGSDNVSTDGGSETEGESETVTIDPMSLDVNDPDDREVLAAVPFDDLEREVYHSQATDVDPSQVDLPIDPQAIGDGDLVEALNPDFPHEFDDPEQMAELLADMIGYVVNHPVYTDDEGAIREEMDILAVLSELDSLAADKAGAPIADVERRVLMLTVDELDKGERLQDRVEELRSSAPTVDAPTAAQSRSEAVSSGPNPKGQRVENTDPQPPIEDVEADDGETEFAADETLDPLESSELVSSLGIDIDGLPDHVLDSSVEPEDREFRLLEWLGSADDPTEFIDDDDLDEDGDE